MDPLTLALTILGALAPVVAVIVGWLLTRRRLQEIHVLVNARLDSVTSELNHLRELRDQEGAAAKLIVLTAAAAVVPPVDEHGFVGAVNIAAAKVNAAAAAAAAAVPATPQAGEHL